MSRGIRNKNPGNIRHSKSNWLGMSATQMDPAFVTFTSPGYGIRAMVKLLWNYHNLYGDQTIKDLISRWAPSNENDTRAYWTSVGLRMGADPDLPLDFGDKEMWMKLLKAIIQHENGQMPYTDEQLFQGVQLAGIRLAQEREIEHG